MFTGIIEEIGTITLIKKLPNCLKLSIKADIILKDIKIGDSISINGICLTVTKILQKTITFDVMPETIAATTLKNLNIDSMVNLERSISANGRFGGHFLSGHIDGVGKIKKIEKNANAINYQIVIPKILLKYCIYRGSIAIDGTSLTIFAINNDSIKIALIPHTVKNTILGNKKIDDLVNIECDTIAKYISKFTLESQQINKLNQQYLLENGFI